MGAVVGIVRRNVSNTPVPPSLLCADSESLPGDFGIFILSERLGDNLGYFGAVVPDMNHYDIEGYFETMGYPGDRDNGARPYRQYVSTTHPHSPVY